MGYGRQQSSIVGWAHGGIPKAFTNIWGLSPKQAWPSCPFPFFPLSEGFGKRRGHKQYIRVFALRTSARCSGGTNTRNRARQAGSARSLVGHASHSLPARLFLSRFGPVGRVWSPLGAMQAHRWIFVGHVTLRDPSTRPHGISEDPMSTQSEPTGWRTTCGGRSTCRS